MYGSFVRDVVEHGRSQNKKLNKSVGKAFKIFKGF